MNVMNIVFHIDWDFKVEFLAQSLKRKCFDVTKDKQNRFKRLH